MLKHCDILDKLLVWDSESLYSVPGYAEDWCMISLNCFFKALPLLTSFVYLAHLTGKPSRQGLGILWYLAKWGLHLKKKLAYATINKTINIVVKDLVTTGYNLLGISMEDRTLKSISAKSLANWLWLKGRYNRSDGKYNVLFGLGLWNGLWNRHPHKQWLSLHGFLIMLEAGACSILSKAGLELGGLCRAVLVCHNMTNPQPSPYLLQNPFKCSFVG